MAQPNPFSAIVTKLRKFYGRPETPKITDALELILWENVAYLADDEKRASAFAALKNRVGTHADQILKASQKELEEITRIGGIVPELRAQRLRQIAETVHFIFKDDLAAELKKPLPQAKKSLKSVSDGRRPRSGKVLMLTRSYPVVAGIKWPARVVAFGICRREEETSYRGVQEALAGQLPTDYDGLIVTHQLLRQHGQELCKRSRPLCEAGCPLTTVCRYYQRSVR